MLVYFKNKFWQIHIGHEDLKMEIETFVPNEDSPLYMYMYVFTKFMHSKILW